MIDINFTESKNKFDRLYRINKVLEKSLVPVHGKYKENIQIKNKDGTKNEEYYKWQFIYSLMNSNLFNKDYICTEVYFPKGNPSSKPLEIDCVIFDNENWKIHYNNYWKNKEQSDLEWLRNHLSVAIEFKNENGKNLKKYINQQLFPAMKESEKEFILGVYYDSERLHLFQKKNNKIIRFDESKNKKGDKSSISDQSLEIPDSYLLIPSYHDLINKKTSFSRKKRKNNDLEIISGIGETKINDALSNILRSLDSLGLFNQIGHKILIEILAVKLFDESESENNNQYLNFYIEDDEKNFTKLSETHIQNFRSRIQNIFDNAKGEYNKILGNSVINWKQISHIRAITTIVDSFQDYSFINSSKTNLYQLVFYKFSNEFAKERNGQFLTPIPLIEFLVNIVNPRGNDKLIDPCAGTSDFLSISYVNSPELNDKNLFGIDNDEQMIMLSQLNMLLNGDGNANLEYVEDKGSINNKFDITGKIVSLIPEYHKNGNWDEWPDNTELMKFDVVLTNPPFGEDRAYKVKTEKDKKIIELYELWKLNNINNKWIDLGLVFLENAIRILNENGRLGIVLSNSIASIDRWSESRKWLMDNLRIVALFDLPANVFTDTGVNTTLVVGYKPEKSKLIDLKNQNYEIFIRDIKKVGYEVRTSRRIKYFNDIYKIDNETFEIEIDNNGKPKIDEEFSEIIDDFKEWAMHQEKDLINAFLGEKNE